MSNLRGLEMQIEDYGIGFMGKKSSNREPNIYPFLEAFYEPGGTNRAMYLPVFWHGEQVLRIRVKFCPSIKSIYVHIYAANLKASLKKDEFTEDLFNALPPLIDHGKMLIGRIIMES